MLFNSFTFLIFFLIVFGVYWYVLNKQTEKQNVFILLANYIFLGWVDWRFVLFLLTSSAIHFFLGKAIAKSPEGSKRKALLYTGLVLGLGGLLFFKYSNFFILSVQHLFNLLHLNLHAGTLSVLLPLGISFYTFRGASYLFDVDNEDVEAEQSWVNFFMYMSFFPALLSGPIDKARDFLPKLHKVRTFEYANATDALRQILWGLFKKVVIADNCALVVDQVFDNSFDYNGSTLLITAFFYLIQLYADFSGYSDMAIGIAKLLGFNITRNFNYPFFAQNIAEFWQKWHISLTSWMTEYVYTPISFALRTWGRTGVIVAVIINFLLVGFWHGANWTFIVYGFLHGCYFIPLILRGTLNNTRKEAEQNKLIPSFRVVLNITGTMLLVIVTLVIFKADSMKQAGEYYQILFSSTLFSAPILPIKVKAFLLYLTFIVGMLIVEWIGKNKEHGISGLGISWPRIIRWSLYFCMLFLILFYIGKEQEFIYFQF